MEEFKDTINSIINNYRTEIVGVTFSLPGRIDQSTAMIYGGGSLEYNHMKTINELFELADLKYAVENDAKVSVLAEMWLGELKGVLNGASIVLGTGIGGGLLLNGEVYRGNNYAAGEVSIIIPGYVEEFTKAAGLEGSAVAMIQKINRMCGEKDINDGIKAFTHIKAGEKKAIDIFENFCKTIAYVIFNLQVTLDLEKIVLSGGISNQQIVTETINKYFDQLLNVQPVVKRTIFKPEIVQSHFKSESNLYGALYNLILKYEEDIQL